MLRRPLALAVALALPPPAAAQPVADEAETAMLERVEVVGSRIKRVELETSQPVFTLDRADIERTGLTSVGDIVQDLTVHGASLNTTFNNGGDGSTRVDLRNLGDNRTLVLLDGRRFIPDVDGAVDLNAIPLAMVERIEVLKDGASAIYGSDAIAGVVNVITRRDFAGIETRAQLAEFEQGDGRSELVEALLGAVGERSVVTLGVSSVTQESIFAGARAISAVPVFGVPGNDVRAGASLISPLGLFGFGPRGLCPFDPSGSYPQAPCPRPDGRPPPANRSTFDPVSGAYRLFAPATDGYNFAPDNYLQTPQERAALFASARHGLGEATTFRVQILHNERRSEQQLAPQPVQLGAVQLGRSRHTVPADHVYNPFGQPVTAVWIRPGSLPRQFAQDADTLRIAAGLDGVVEFAARSWWWDVHASYADYSIAELTRGLPDLDRMRSALGPSFRDADGIARCGTPEAPVAGCVPLDAFRGPANVTPEMLDYVFVDGSGRTRSRAHVLAANVTGDLLDLPAGALALAAGVEHRRERGERRLDALQVAIGNLQDESFAGRVAVDEAYAEFAAPLLADRPGARRLEANVAARWSDYDSFGDTTNFEAGMRWQPLESLVVRTSWSEGFRAPIVAELFFPNTVGIDGGQSDPCNAENAPDAATRANCAADGVPGGVYEATGGIYQVIDGGNPTLQPETAISRAAGVVWSPEGLPGFDLSLDWYAIEIEDAIASVFYVDLLRYCALAGVPEACARTERGPDGALTRVDSRRLNSGGLDVEGYDLTASWQGDTRFGRLRVVWDTTYTARYEAEVPRGAPPTPAPGNYTSREPGWRIRSNLDLAWTRGPWSAAAGLRYYDDLDEACLTPVRAGYPELCSDPTISSPTFLGAAENRIGARTYVDLQLAWDAPWGSRLTLGVNNAFDRDPPLSYSTFANSFDPAYPIPGRFWYVGWRHAF